MRRALLGMVLALVLVLVGCSETGSDGAPVGSDSQVVLAMGACPAMDGSPAVAGALPLKEFPCLTGSGELTLGIPPGRPTVVNLWAPWCGPCKEELPLFDRLYQQAGDVITVVGLVEKDTRASSVAFAAEFRLTFPSALDETGELSTALGLNGLPVTFFLRADGSIAHRQIGPITSYEELLGLVAQHLGVDA